MHFRPPADRLDAIASRLAPAEQFPGDAELVRIALPFVELGPQPVQLVRGNVARERKIGIRGGLGGKFLPLPLSGFFVPLGNSPFGIQFAADGDVRPELQQVGCNVQSIRRRQAVVVIDPVEIDLSDFR